MAIINPGNLIIKQMQMHPLNKILIANRGEIALRIIRAARSLGIRTVALYTPAESSAPHVRLADESIALGEGPLSDTYLNIQKIISAAKASKADAIHPGYGFLSESHLLAQACIDNGIRFIGPSPEVLKLMGNKTEAKKQAEQLGIPVLHNVKVNDSDITGISGDLRFPLLIKSSFGGGGKGMQVVRSLDELKEKITRASRMALNYFGNGEIYLEPYIETARHIEVQVLGDHHGNLVHLFERDCTLQRNHQKIVEEAPAPGLPEDLRQRLLTDALRLCRSVDYTNAGTVEFLLDNHGRYYFMEMNPRIQVEHPVTEEVTGIDIVREQIRIAAGLPLSFTQEDVRVSGHAIQVRIYSEDPLNGFAPSAAPVSFFRLPSMPGVRIETDMSEETQATGSQFDPLLAKIIAHATDRPEAILLLTGALRQTIISGPVTNQTYLLALLGHPAVQDACTHTLFCTEELPALAGEMQSMQHSVPVEILVAAFLHLKFLPKSGTRNHPWAHLGFQNILNSIDLSIDSRHFIVSFKLTPPKMNQGKKEFTVADQDQVYFTFEFDGISYTAGSYPSSGQSLALTINNHPTEIFHSENQKGITVLNWNGLEYHLSSRDLLECYPVRTSNSELNAHHDHEVRSHLHGKVLGIPVRPGQAIERGDLLMIIEAMKSENHIMAPKNGIIKTIEVSPGTQVTDQMTLLTFEEV